MTLRDLNLDEHWWEDGIFNGLTLQLQNAKREQQLHGTNYKLVLVVGALQHSVHIKVTDSTELKKKKLLQDIISK